ADGTEAGDGDQAAGEGDGGGRHHAGGEPGERDSVDAQQRGWQGEQRVEDPGGQDGHAEPDGHAEHHAGGHGDHAFDGGGHEHLAGGRTEGPHDRVLPAAFEDQEGAEHGDAERRDDDGAGGLDLGQAGQVEGGEGVL